MLTLYYVSAPETRKSLNHNATCLHVPPNASVCLHVPAASLSELLCAACLHFVHDLIKISKFTINAETFQTQTYFCFLGKYKNYCTRASDNQCQLSSFSSEKGISINVFFCHTRHALVKVGLVNHFCDRKSPSIRAKQFFLKM